MKYVGIDIGDGESAVTVVSEDGAILPAVVPLGNVKSIRSVVGTLKDKAVIGDQVILNHAVKNRSARFKSRFLYEKSAQEDLRRFAEGLYELLKKSQYDTDWKIALGCPAGWKREERERYGAIVTSAGFHDLYTVSESRAAFLYAHHSNEMNLSSETLNRPTLVIDIGSSTLDYAYIVEGKERDVSVFGENRLGGGILDALILEYAIKQSPNQSAIRETLNKSLSWRSYCELIARKLKEEYFLSEEKWDEKVCSSIAPIYADPNNALTVQILLSGAIMKQLLNQVLPELEGKSFRQALRDSLERAKDVTSEQPPELLIVTGGASRMKFFQELCQETFPNAMLALCGEPEFSIARGLGIAARTDDMLTQFRTKVAAYFSSGAVEMEIEQQLPQLLPDYVPVVSHVLEKEAVRSAILNFTGDASNVAQLNSYIQDKLGDVLRDPALMQNADEIVNKWIAARLNRVQDKLNQLCDEFRIDRADMSLVQIHTEVKTPEIRVPLILRLFAATNQQPWMQKLFKGFSLLQVIMAGQIRKRLNAELADPGGEFAKCLNEQLVLELQRQIDAQTKKVEIQIH